VGDPRSTRVLGAAVGRVGEDLRGLWVSAGPGARALYLGGLLLLGSGALHGLVYAIDGGGWSGPLSWRKPILFGISTGATLLSLGWVLGLVLPPGGRERWLGAAVAGASVLEVALVTLQTWRGEASHFNTGTPVDAVIYRMIEVGVAVLFLGVAGLSARVLGPLPPQRLPLADRIAVRVGMALLLIGALLGVLMTVHGHEALQHGDDPRIFGEAGALKFAHGIPLHAIQWLPLTAWAARRLGSPEGHRTVGLSVMSAGLVALSGFAAWQTFAGRARFDLTPASGALLAVACIASVLPPVFFALPAAWTREADAPTGPPRRPSRRRG